MKLKEYQEKHPEKLKEIKEIFKNAGFEATEKALESVIKLLHTNSLEEVFKTFPNEYYLEFAKLVLFLKNSTGGVIELKSTVKGSQEKAKIESDYINKQLFLSIYKLFLDATEGRYTTFISSNGGNPLYSIEDLEKIIDSEIKEGVWNTPLEYKSKFILSCLYTSLVKSESFQVRIKEGDKRKGITKEYNLLYDIGVFMELFKVDKDKNRKQRYEFIRYEIEAYDTFLRKKYINSY